MSSDRGPIHAPTLMIAIVGLGAIGVILAGLIVFLWGTVDGSIERDLAEMNASDLEWSMEVCTYGSEMFYVARDVPDARELAISDCTNYLADNGEEWFLDFYGIGGPAGLKEVAKP